ncbi:MAG: DEAD/DEAH box helicase [Prevotella sp.]|nr:DEAD/DEAH box helicase [Prevotella sp.]
MKIKYKHQRFQAEAAKCVTDVFMGQPKSEGLDSFLVDQGTNRGLYEVEGFGNAPIALSRDSLCDNVRTVQMAQGLKPVEQLQGEGLTLTIEMETGTGKTYTYIKTMFELNRLYGWSKFIIVVPSIAIREGVFKSFESMAEHFATEYGKRMQYFIYNSKQLSKIDGFAQDNGIHVMVINTQAFNASMNEEKNQEGRKGDAAARIIFSRRDEFGSRRPIDILAKTNPILIIDEPQSVLGTDKKNTTRKGIELFNPLFKLLYSATHRKDDIYNLVFRLDAIDAFNKKLVKKVEVRGVHQVGSTATNGYVFLDEIVISKGNPRARIGFDVKTANGTRQVLRLMDEHFNLKEQSGGLHEYDDNYVIDRIDGLTGTIHFLNGLTLQEGEMVGAANEDLVRRMQIRETIKTHLERERQLFPKHIKVLSLFFIDHVENYRIYDKDGAKKGKYAQIFEEEYQRALQEMMPTFTDGEYTRFLSDYHNACEHIHDGYFSIDKKGVSVESKNKEGENEERGFNLIMKDKERLLSQDCPVRFIFSHSALKEGWDNPNVFQICTLKETSNEIKKRQEVGRGMRLCVNAKGERQDAEVLGDAVFDTNVLTVIASESYDDFAKKLQTEIAEACDGRPVVVTATLFADETTQTDEGKLIKVTTEQAVDIHEKLISQGYIKQGKLTPKFFDKKKNGTLDFGEMNMMKSFIVKQLDKVFNPDNYKPENGKRKKEANFNPTNFQKKEWQELWKRINVRTYYQVNFDTAKLIDKAVKEINDRLNVSEIRIVVESGSMESIRDKEELEAGATMSSAKVRTIRVSEAVGSGVKYDLIGDLVQITGLTRRTIVTILQSIEPSKFLQFKLNPEEFIIKTGRIINDCKALSLIQHIKYEKRDHTFESDIFEEATLRGVIGKNAIESEKSLYDLVVVDSEGIEMSFAESLEKEDDVVVYTKLPNGFYINTPMGKYNPDWAVAFREGSVKHVYFVAETKGNDIEASQNRGSENAKIECARHHFASISTGEVVFSVVKTYQDLYNVVIK